MEKKPRAQTDSGSGIDLRQMQSAEQLQKMIETTTTIRHQHRLLIVDHTVSRARKVLSEARRDQEAFRSTIPEKSMPGLETRFVRSAAARLAYSGFYDDDMINADHDLRIPVEVTDAMDTEMEDELLEWLKKQNQNRCEFQMFPHEKIPEAAYSSHLYLNRIIGQIDTAYKNDQSKREIFEKVRQAKVIEMTRDNIGDLLVPLEKIYDANLLKEDTIDLLRYNDPDTNRAFEEQTQKGIFVFGFREKWKGAPSVREQMIDDFTKEREFDEPKYRGWVLQEPDKDEILAYLTMWEPPYQPSKKYADMMTQYLETGVTGAPMNWSAKPEKHELLPYVNTTVMIDTICGSVKSAAARLFARAMLEIYSKHKNLDFFIGYRLRHIFFHPAFEACRRPVPLAQNVSSATFFHKRHCVDIADDFNADGPSSVRTLDDGMNIWLNPMWTAFEGEYHLVMNNAWEVWRGIQKEFGDISTDYYDPKHFQNMQPRIFKKPDIASRLKKPT